jgi:hypothetical protein
MSRKIPSFVGVFVVENNMPVGSKVAPDTQKMHKNQKPG